MGFFDIFRKKKVSVEVKEISLERFSEEVGVLLRECDKTEEEILDLAFGQRKFFVDNLFVEKMGILRGANLEKRKEDLKLKKRVLDGKDSYIKFCENLTRRIIELKGESFEEYFRLLSRLIANFEKESAKSFSIANILIGEEIAEVRKVIRDFFKFNEEIFSDNKAVFSRKRYLKSLLEKYSSFRSSYNLREEMDGEVKVLDELIEEKRVSLNEAEKKLLDFRNSKRFKELLNEEKERKKERGELFNQMESLKGQIDFKNLLNIHHKNDRVKDLIRDYKDNFSAALIGDKQNDFLKIVGESLSEELAKVKRIFVNLDKEFLSDVKEEWSRLEGDVEKILSEISVLTTRKEESEKRAEKLKVKEDKKFDELKTSLADLNFKLID